MKIKNQTFICFVLITIQLVLSTTCAKKADPQQTHADQFLRTFFAFNQNERSAFVQNPADYQKYCDKFQTFTTEKCLDEMTASRLPFKYDQLAYEEGATYQIEGVKLTALNDDTYDYEVTLVKEASGSSSEVAAKGQIRIIYVDQKWLIDNIYLRVLE